MVDILSELLSGALDLVFAPICVACSKPIPTAARERGVCVMCWARARTLPLPRCDRCWTPLVDLGTGDQIPCFFCPDLRAAVRCVRSAFLLEGPVRPTVHALKYRGWHSLATPMARRMATLDLPIEVEEEIEVAVSVPVSASRRRQRGYNQAELLAREVADIKGWEVCADILARDRSTGTQTTLHRSERRANVAGAFRARHELAQAIEGKHALLVDDVWTTGATALACCDILLDVGARAVSVLTFARSLPDLERHAQRVESLAFS